MHIGTSVYVSFCIVTTAKTMSTSLSWLDCHMLQSSPLSAAGQWLCSTAALLSARGRAGTMQAVNEDGVLAWTRVTVLRSFRPQLPDTRFLRMTTAAGQVRTTVWSRPPRGMSSDAACCCHPARHDDRHCRRFSNPHVAPCYKVAGTMITCPSAGSLLYDFCGVRC